ncbi:MAG TPA: hypothetical protein ENK90_02070, partial [Epsilonproteobacteria bacterium]|nr:hypothetical protein [Campylobacterota bacterium]
MKTYRLTGNNHHQTILFVHGLGANLSQFEEQHHYFDNKYQILSLTLSNHSLDYLADEIIILLDRLQIEKVHFVGNSMGGNVGFALLKQ